METRRISGRGAVTALIAAVFVAGLIISGVSAYRDRASHPTSPQAPGVSATTAAAPPATPFAPAIFSTAPAVSPDSRTVAVPSPGISSVVPTALPSTATAMAFDAERLYTAVGPAVVTISNQQSNAKGSTTREANAGSGVIYDAQGDILTNRHVIDGADAIEITVQGGKTVAGTLIGQDPVADIAVVRIDPAAVPAVAPFGDSSLVRAGQRVVVIGSPLQFAGSITRGIISGTDRSIGGMDGLMQTDAAISPGNSGGPLVNGQGEVIGIATSTIRTNQAERIGFAIPGNYARRLAGIIVADGKVTRPYLGVTTELLTPGSAVDLKVAVGRGAYVSETAPNTPAASAGIRKGDVIVAINGANVGSANPLNVLLLDFKPGETVTVTINRDGAERQIPATLAERPASLDP